MTEGDKTDSTSRKKQSRRNTLFGYNTALCPITSRNPARLRFTSRKTKRWIIPKGWRIKGLKPAKSAAREAYEEAGLRGYVKTKAIGIFSYEKRLDEDGITFLCDVRVIPLLVKRPSSELLDGLSQRSH
jgi:8-oxo-dGTP pyrophosphatase MutT (NUDIX family)